MDAIVNNLLPVDAVLLLQIRIETGLDVLDDRSPALQVTYQRQIPRKAPFRDLPVFVVDKVTEAWCVYDGETEANTVLLDI